MRLFVADFKRKSIIQQYFRDDFFGEANLSTDPFLKKYRRNAENLLTKPPASVIIALTEVSSLLLYGGIAQLARAHGSYP